MTHNKVRYWRSRMMDRLVSLGKQRKIDLEDILYDVRHINLEEEEIIKALRMITTAFIELEKAIMKAKVKKNGN